MTAHFEAGWHEARLAVHRATPVGDSESVPVAHAHGRVVAADVTAQSDMPPFAATRVDGWAVAGPGPWRPIGDTRAGHTEMLTLALGECVHTATGAALPAGATACLKDEESVLRDGWVHAAAGAVTLMDSIGALPDGHDVRPAGFEARTGEVLIPSGTVLSPGAVGVAAGAGHDALSVYHRPLVDILVFGDELLGSGASRDGKVRDSLGPQLPGWIARLGAECISVTRVADTLEAHVNAIAASHADLIVTTGGTAAGPVDYLHSAITECGGDLLIDAVLVRPGYHQLFAQLPGRALVGLPGNPQSAVIGLLSLGDAFLRARTGRPLPVLDQVELAAPVKAPGREVRLALATLTSGRAQPVPHADSSMLRGFVEADGFAVVPPGGAHSGALVEWLPLP